MNDKEIKELVEQTCKTCVNCKYLDINEGETRLNCNKKDLPISEDFLKCKDFESTAIAVVDNKPLPKEKQEQFCQEYLVDFNKTQAAIRAGYSVKTATAIGHENLTKPNIIERVECLLKIRAARVNIDQDQVLKDLIQIKDRCMQSVPVQEWNAGLQMYVDKHDAEGNQLYEFDSAAAIKALDLLGKHLGIYDSHNKQKSNITIDFTE